MHTAHVSRESTLLRGAVRAQVAREGPFPGVCAHVPLQVGLAVHVALAILAHHAS